jgi:tRNA-2-methylthio-N6-dimethylallyladenosine synthase
LSAVSIRVPDAASAPGPDVAPAPSKDQARRVFVKSFGCQMNVYDSHRMIDVAATQGFEETLRIEDADLVVLNTCHIRERASEKIYSELGKIRELKEERAAAGRGTTIVVAGCVAQAEGANIVRRQSAVDLVVGPQNYHRLPELLGAAALRPGIVDADFPIEDKFDHLPSPTAAVIRARGVAAFVTVQEGCDKFCSFCVVPYTRGAESSRSVTKVVEEVARLARAGVREVTLIGQNVNAYHGQGPDGRPWSLARLIEHVAGKREIARIRYMTSHPRDMSEDLIAAHRDIPKLMPFLHLPIQSGSDRILAAMNRRHGRREYLDIIARVRAARPDIAISSDFIVGFPGETEEDFALLLDWLGEAELDRVGCFRYEPVDGAAANGLAPPVPNEIKQERWDRLMRHQQAISAKRLKRKIGTRQQIIIDEIGPTVARGRSHADAPEIDGSVFLASRRPLRVGEIVTARIERADAYDLHGAAIGF